MEIVIVGAGPVGCYTAQLLRHYGIKTRIIEEHNEVGKPVKCAGIVGRPVFEKLIIAPVKSSMVNQINGALFFYQKENFKIMREKVAYVIDRERFDKDLSNGLKIEYRKKLLKIEKEGAGYQLTTDNDEIYADMVIGADGPMSRVRKFLLSEFVGKNRDEMEYYIGYQYRIKLDGRIRDSEIVQVYVKENIPFFIWIIPENKDIIRLGVISKNGGEIIDNFLKASEIKGEIIEKLGGIIPIGLVQKTCSKSIALVGDAAGQVKPLTGGGIYYGLKSAEILVECIKEGKLVEYDKRWKKKFGREIKFGLRARRIYERLNKLELNNIFYLFKENSEFIEKVANFENHSLVFREALKNPKIFIKVGNILGRNIRKILF